MSKNPSYSTILLALTLIASVALVQSSVYERVYNQAEYGNLPYYLVAQDDYILGGDWQSMFLVNRTTQEIFDVTDEFSNNYLYPSYCVLYTQERLFCPTNADATVDYVLEIKFEDNKIVVLQNITFDPSVSAIHLNNFLGFYNDLGYVWRSGEEDSYQLPFHFQAFDPSTAEIVQNYTVYTYFTDEFHAVWQDDANDMYAVQTTPQPSSIFFELRKYNLPQNTSELIIELPFDEAETILQFHHDEEDGFFILGDRHVVGVSSDGTQQVDMNFEQEGEQVVSLAPGTFFTFTSTTAVAWRFKNFQFKKLWTVDISKFYFFGGVHIEGADQLIFGNAIYENKYFLYNVSETQFDLIETSPFATSWNTSVVYDAADQKIYEISRSYTEARDLQGNQVSGGYDYNYLDFYVPAYKTDTLYGFNIDNKGRGCFENVTPQHTSSRCYGSFTNTDGQEWKLLAADFESQDEDELAFFVQSGTSDFYVIYKQNSYPVDFKSISNYTYALGGIDFQNDQVSLVLCAPKVGCTIQYATLSSQALNGSTIIPVGDMYKVDETHFVFAAASLTNPKSFKLFDTNSRTYVWQGSVSFDFATNQVSGVVGLNVDTSDSSNVSGHLAVLANNGAVFDIDMASGNGQKALTVDAGSSINQAGGSSFLIQSNYGQYECFAQNQIFTLSGTNEIDQIDL